MKEDLILDWYLEKPEWPVFCDRKKAAEDFRYPDTGGDDGVPFIRYENDKQRGF